MFVWNDLPDTLAFAALVLVFVSLVRLQHDKLLGAWIVGWILVVIHFAAKLFNPGDANVPLDVLSWWALELAGFAFIWAAVVRRLDPRDLLVFGTLAVPVLIEMVLMDANVQPAGAYIATIVPGALAAFVVLGIDPRLTRRERVYTLAAVAAANASLLLVLAFDAQRSDLLSVVLTWEFAIAGAQYWRRFRHATTGVLTTVCGFVAWGLVFPLAWFQGTYFPKVQIDDAAWNIPKYIVAIGIIVTLLEQQMERSRYLAEHDELTGLPNRRLLEAKLRRLVKRSHLPFALITVDLDRFKEVNDTLGHEAGDAMLRVLADRFHEHTGERDICARFGGDEFVIVAPDIGERDAASRFVQRLRDVVLADPIEIEGERIVPQASIGVALYPAEAADLRSLFTRSDRDMYEAKLRGRSDLTPDLT